MPNMSLLIVGGRGLLGAELVRQATAAGRRTAATFTNGPSPADRTNLRWYALDLREAEQVEAVVAKVRPRVIVNASSGRADWAVAAEGPLRLAVAAVRHGCRLVHVSSDAVFSGARAQHAEDTPYAQHAQYAQYDETCLPDPVTPYGAAKAAAETGMRVLLPDAVVARTSLIIDGDNPPSGRPCTSPHVRVVHDLATGVRDGVLFSDDIRCPVHVSDLAAALLELAHSDARGVHHLAGADAVSRHELGLLVARRDGLDAFRLTAGLRADTALPGALDVRLDSRTTQRKLRTVLRGARTFLAAT